jgi:hypothetical protein
MKPASNSPVTWPNPPIACRAPIRASHSCFGLTSTMNMLATVFAAAKPRPSRPASAAFSGRPRSAGISSSGTSVTSMPARRTCRCSRRRSARWPKNGAVKPARFITPTMAPAWAMPPEDKGSSKGSIPPCTMPRQPYARNQGSNHRRICLGNVTSPCGKFACGLWWKGCGHNGPAGSVECVIRFMPFACRSLSPCNDRTAMARNHARLACCCEGPERKLQRMAAPPLQTLDLATSYSRISTATAISRRASSSVPTVMHR